MPPLALARARQKRRKVPAYREGPYLVEEGYAMGDQDGEVAHL